MRRPVFTVTLLLVSLAGLTAPTMARNPQFIIGYPEDDMSNDWRAAQVAEVERELRKYPNIRFLKADAGGSIAKNILDIDTMVKQGAQLLFLGPRNPDSLSRVTARLRKQGIRIILLTRKLNTEDYDTYISPDDFKIAYDAAEFMAAQLHGKGRILMLEGVPSTTTAKRRRQGFLTGLENYSQIKVISKVANYSRADAIIQVEELLTQGQKFDAIFAHNDAMAAGARVALHQAGINPASIPTVGIDFLPETRTAIIEGKQLASFTYPTCGKVGVKVAIDLLQGKQVPRYIVVPSQRVTRDNVNDIPTVY